jgi:hypothetical protein
MKNPLKLRQIKVHNKKEAYWISVRENKHKLPTRETVTENANIDDMNSCT